MSSVAGWLCLGGQEVINEERTRAYLRNCLGDSSWQFFDCDCPPLAAHIVEGGCALVLDGTAGTNASTPDKAALDITGDIELGALVALDDWTPTAAGKSVQQVVCKDNETYALAVGQTFNSGRLILVARDSGGTARIFISTVAPTVVDGEPLFIKGLLDVDNGESQRVVEFFTKPNLLGGNPLAEYENPAGWTQLGSPVVQAGAITLTTSLGPLRFGDRTGTSQALEGRGYLGVVKDGIDGTLVASPDFTAQAPGTTSFTDAQGNVYTLNGNAEITCALDYGSPATDPAPWYSDQNPASEKFFGFLPERSELSVPTSRAVTQRIDGGGVLGPELMLPRNVEFRGWLVAADEEGMRWGIRWMQEVLRGRICAPGCSPGDLSLLTSCADPSYFRGMIGAGLVDGPRFDVAVPDNYESVAVPTQFQLAVEMPYLYHDPSEVVSGEVEDGTSECAFFTTEEWFDGADLQIEISSEANASDLTLTMAVSLDGTCDELAQPCAKLTIPLLPAEGKLTIDGRRRQVRFFNPTRRTEEAGYRVVDWIGAFPYFDVAACAQMCICLDNAGSEPVSWTVTKWEREL